MAVPENIEELAHQIRTAIYGRDVRESLASSMEATADVADWARHVAQQIIDGEFDEGALKTEIERKLNELEENYAPNLNSLEVEVSGARGSYDNLNERISSSEAFLSEALKNSFSDKNRAELYSKLLNLEITSGTVTMVGDSLTGGVSSGGHPWYEPLETLFPNINFINKGVGGDTSKKVLNRIEDITLTQADLYIIAVGANDVRYQNSDSSLTPTEYVGVIQEIITTLDSDIVCINPWPAFNNDRNSALGYYQRDELTDEFTKALSEYCYQNSIPFIETNNNLRSEIDWGNSDIVLVDQIHPKYPNGINMYSDAVLYGNVKGYNYGLKKTESLGKHVYRLEILSVSNLETNNDGFVLKRLLADEEILEVWSDNFRSSLNNPDVLIMPYDEDPSSRFANDIGVYPINILFSSNNPIKNLKQLEDSNFRAIGSYRIYYSNNKKSILDFNHESWELKYESLDTDPAVNLTIYDEPAQSMEQRHYYCVELMPTGTSLDLISIEPDQTPLKIYGKDFSTFNPLTSHIFSQHEKRAATGSSVKATTFFSTNKKLSNIKVAFQSKSSQYNIVIKHSDRFNVFNTAENDYRWEEIYSQSSVNDGIVLSANIPNH